MNIHQKIDPHHQHSERRNSFSHPRHHCPSSSSSSQDDYQDNSRSQLVSLTQLQAIFSSSLLVKISGNCTKLASLEKLKILLQRYLTLQHKIDHLQNKHWRQQSRCRTDSVENVHQKFCVICCASIWQLTSSRHIYIYIGETFSDKPLLCNSTQHNIKHKRLCLKWFKLWKLWKKI